MKIGRLLLCLGLAGIGVLAALPATAGAEITAAYVACSSSGDALPAEECTLGESPAAFFESDEDVQYAICVESPDDSVECLTGQEAAANVLYFNGITAEQEGLWWVDWYLPVEGEPEEFIHVASWPFFMKAPPAPPSPPLPPPPPPAAPPVIEPVTSAVCAKARQRVKLARVQLRAAEGRKKRAALRKKLKRARAAVKRAC